MKISRLLLLAAVLASRLSAQSPEQRKRFQDIQERRQRGEQINDADIEFAKAMMTKTRQRQGAGAESVERGILLAFTTLLGQMAGWRASPLSQLAPGFGWS